MRMTLHRWLASLVMSAFILIPAMSLSADTQPVGLLLTWQRDPTTTMTIDWHTLTSDTPTESAVRYRKRGEASWNEAQGDARPFPYSDRTVHRVELSDLAPDTRYEFRVGAFERVYQFHTMPVDVTEPIRFAVGGDTRHNQSLMEKTNRAAMRHDPAFVYWGGDLAYANGSESGADKWYEWFDANMNTLITEEGRVVPVIVAIGNHEVREGTYARHKDYEHTDEWRLRIAPYFYTFFAFPGHPGYNVLDFGDYMSLIVLDTNHTNPIPGEQTKWLARTLKERRHVPHLFPNYHTPAYPSVRNFDSGSASNIRHRWIPLFQEYGVRLAFENHDHAYKRTVAIRDNKPHPAGIVYLGDGAWGVGTRDVHSADDTWYLQHSKSVRHAIIVTIHGPQQHVLVVDENGKVIDEFPQTPR